MMTHKIIDGILAVKPTREDVVNLKVGDLAPTCFGGWAKVVAIFAQKDDVAGKAFACYYTDCGDGATMSGSVKEGEIVATVPLTRYFKRTDLVPW